MICSCCAVALNIRRILFALVLLSGCALPAYALNVTDRVDSNRLELHLQKVINTPRVTLDEKLQILLAAADTDKDRAWLVYRWVTHHFKHDSRLASRIGDPEKHSLDELYQLAGGSCAVYANVIQRLMVRAGLEVKTIHGMAKGGVATSIINGKPVNHVWNAVRLDGEWKLIDATWGAGHVGRDGFQKEQSDLFFLIPSNLAVLSHFDAFDELGHQRLYGMNYNKFKDLPDDAFYVASVGFDVKSIIPSYRRFSSKPLVSTFNQKPGTFRVINAPVEGNVKRTPQKFKIESSAYEEIMLVQGKSWSPLTKQNTLYELSIRPEKGELIIMGRRPKQQEYEALLAYTVN